jgi:hypothetical protein
MSRYVVPETKTLTISNGDTLVVRKRLNRGEQTAAFARRYIHGALEGARALLEAVDGSHSGQVTGQDEKNAPTRGA